MLEAIPLRFTCNCLLLTVQVHHLTCLQVLCHLRLPHLLLHLRRADSRHTQVRFLGFTSNGGWNHWGRLLKKQMKRLLGTKDQGNPSVAPFQQWGEKPLPCWFTASQSQMCNSAFLCLHCIVPHSETLHQPFMAWILQSDHFSYRNVYIEKVSMETSDSWVNCRSGLKQNWTLYDMNNRIPCWSERCLCCRTAVLGISFGLTFLLLALILLLCFASHILVS